MLPIMKLSSVYSAESQQPCGLGLAKELLQRLNAVSPILNNKDMLLLLSILEQVYILSMFLHVKKITKLRPTDQFT